MWSLSTIVGPHVQVGTGSSSEGNVGLTLSLSLSLSTCEIVVDDTVDDRDNQE